MVTQEHVLLLVRYSRARCSRLDSYQGVPYGTYAWSKSYGRRSNIELFNKLLKIDEGLSNKTFLCAFGLGAHELAAIMLCVAHNIDVATQFSEDQTAVERGDDELPPCDQIVSRPDDTYFSGRLPEMMQDPPRRPASLVEVLERVTGVISRTPKASDRKSKVRISTDGGPDLFASPLSAEFLWLEEFRHELVNHFGGFA